MPRRAARQRGHKLPILATYVAVALAGALPVVLSVILAHHVATEAEAALLHSYAHNLSHRAQETADQIDGIFARLAAQPGADECSNAHVAIMRSADLIASNVQAVGRVIDGAFVCASMNLDQPTPIGPVDFVAVNGWNIRLNQTFAFAPNTSFIVLESNRWAAIVNKDRLLDTPVDEPDVIMAIVNPANGRVYAARGVMKPSWLKRFSRDPTTSKQIFLDNGYMVALSRTKSYEVIGVAAAPFGNLQARTRKAAWIMVPIGLFLGLTIGAGTLILLRRQQSLRSQLRSAIRKSELSVVYQPVVDLRTRRWVAAEALLRWTRRDGTTVSPEVFIPLAESSGLIGEITDQLFATVAAEASDFFKSAPQFQIALNVSGCDIQSGGLRVKIRDLCEKLGVSPHNLVIEMTERTLIEEKGAKSVLEEIRSDGAHISIDDFGTGYSSLSYLQSFKIDTLKIDSSFVETINSTTQTTEVLAQVISLAQALGLSIVAEGVETTDDAKYLLEHGVGFAQGWLFARAMSRDELLAGLKHQVNS